MHRLLTRPTTMQICSCLPSSGKCQNLFWEMKVIEFKQTGQVEVTRDDWNPQFSQIYNSGKVSGGGGYHLKPLKRTPGTRSTSVTAAGQQYYSWRQTTDWAKGRPVTDLRWCQCVLGVMCLRTDSVKVIQRRADRRDATRLDWCSRQSSACPDFNSWLWPLWGNILIRNLSSVIK